MCAVCACTAPATATIVTQTATRHDKTISLWLELQPFMKLASWYYLEAKMSQKSPPTKSSSEASSCSILTSMPGKAFSRGINSKAHRRVAALILAVKPAWRVSL